MGMAASQARYLSLVARQSNVEYQGQQINQARTALSNQSANLFNQMLGLTVPTPPSTQDYTKTQYSYSDGTNDSVITSWQQLGTSDPDYNYVVTHSYTTNKFTGSLKKLSNPQVQYSSTGVEATEEKLQESLEKMTTKYNAYQDAIANRKVAEAALKTLSSLDTYANPITTTKVEESATGYNVYTSETANYAYTEYSQLGDEDKETVNKTIQQLITNGALPSDYEATGDVYYNSDTGTIAFKDDLAALAEAETGGELDTYLTGEGDDSVIKISKELNAAYTEAVAAETTAKAEYESAQAEYEALNHPTYVGNCELKALDGLTDDQKADVDQIVKDMEEQGIECNIRDCFDEAGNYKGGIYTYTMNNQTYYTTLADLNSSYESTLGNDKPIEDQTKLTYYSAGYIQTTVDKTEKALLETDGSGRFTTVKFEDDSVTYTLNMETITDDNAYQDAMNQYYYDNAVYDKTVQDINAKTSLIQQEDQQLELKLKQLDTERTALKTEIEAVQKVVKDAVESGFKTFGG